ncbi:hypothetical protein B296_00041412 [Ensete ventricosum]|uniref:Uncharacterized protein n=1 Tax=Ensete ventricosum TaxID=4639 RepID=A0A426XLM7_ENSVE|nr:hypothetical protein B296_00041412 [Ensete ventricosum]
MPWAIQELKLCISASHEPEFHLGPIESPSRASWPIMSLNFASRSTSAQVMHLTASPMPGLRLATSSMLKLRLVASPIPETKPCLKALHEEPEARLYFAIDTSKCAALYETMLVGPRRAKYRLNRSKYRWPLIDRV